MEIVVFFLVILKIVNPGLCSNQVLVLKYNRRTDCPNYLVPIKINKALKEFTYCGKYNFRFLKYSILMSLGNDHKMKMSMNDFQNKMGFLSYDGGSYLYDFKSHKLKPDEWHHICYSIAKNQIKIVLDGEILLNEKVDLEIKEITNTTLWLGGMATESKYYKDRRFVGMITDVHLWSTSLDIADIIYITETDTISGTIFPDLFTWPTIKIQSNTTCIEYLVKDKNDELLQQKPPLKIMLIEDQKDFDTSNYLCQAYGGKLFVPKCHNDLKMISVLIEQSKGNCTHAYLGLKKSNDLVTDLDSNVISFVNWGKNQPNGKEYQQCIRIREDTFYDDASCSTEMCSICNIPTKNTFKLRGLIPKNAEEEYSVGLGRTTKDTNIRGMQVTDCFWNGTWIFGEYLKLQEPNSNMPPVGAHKWNNNHILKFTQCNDDEFTCHTFGNCIPMKQRCDGHPDCPEDGSDENKCNMMSLTKGYDKKYPSNKNKNISISIEVMDMIEINELNMDYTIEVKVMMKWFDSRITFRNLKPTHYENQLNDEERDQIWKPELLFLHSKGIQRHRWTVTVHRTGMPKLNKLTEINEDYLYAGNENHITMVDYIVVKLGCKFNLLMYPFDTQRCPIELQRASNFYNQFVMKWNEPPKINDLKLTQYDNLNELGFVNNSLPKTMIEVEIILCRKISYHIVNIYIPTLCLILIAGFTLFIDYSHFETTIMVALTTMLVTYTLYQSISGYLPQTSYMKMIDIWLFGGLLFPFIIITILIIMDSLIMKEINQVIDMKKEKRIRLTSKLFMKLMKISLFVISVIFCAIYWSYGIYHFYFDCSI